MKFFPRYRIIQTISSALIFATVPAVLSFAVIKPFIQEFSFIMTFELLFVIFLCFISYINFQVLHISINNDILTVKYFFHRPEPIFKIDLNEIETIRISSTLKNDRFFEIKTKKGYLINIDLDAIPILKLYDIANKYGIEIINQNIVD